MLEPLVERRDAISFGLFKLVPSERLLIKDGTPVELGARTLDVLIVLTSHPNEPVSKRDLMAKVWPDVTVEEGSLRFQMASLRKALGDGKNGARYITTLAGRGYCFVAPIQRSSGPRDEDLAGFADAPRATFLPSRLGRMVGRQDCIKDVAAQLAASRFVTIVGFGGVGKTTVATAVGHDLLAAFDGAVLFIDLGALSQPAMVPLSVASMLGISIQSDDPVPSLIADIRGKRLLIVLDSCEHVVEAAADLAAKVFQAAPEVHILATSREALRVEGEQVYQLPPLDSPPDDPGLTAADAMKYPAAQLFMERAAAGGARFELDDADAALVAGICRRLDGVALSIELAAGRVGAYGLKQTAMLLDQRLTLLWPGKRTAPPRQKTLQATLDWSYGLLTSFEALTFRRLAVFVGDFTIEAALAVVIAPASDQTRVFSAIDSLIAKSMVAIRSYGTTRQFRLLDTARTYALEVTVDDAERADLAERHAIYYRGWLQRSEADWIAGSDTLERAPLLSALNNVRAGLNWCFGSLGNAEIGIALAALASKVFLSLSLLTECRYWSEQAILAQPNNPAAESEEMHLQSALGIALMFTGGDSDAAQAAFNRSLAISENLQDNSIQLRMLGLLHIFHHRMGNFTTALGYAERSMAICGSAASSAGIALARCQLGISLSYNGNLEHAREELEAALRDGPGPRRTGVIFHGFDHYNISGGYLARTLWLQGFPGEAAERARLTVKEAQVIDQPVTLSIALIWAISVFLWSGDLGSAEEHIDRLIAHAESPSLRPYLAAARCFEGELAVRRGDVDRGLASLRKCLGELRDSRYQLLVTRFKAALAEALIAAGRYAEGVHYTDEAVSWAQTRGELSHLPELLRLRGVLLSLPPTADNAGAQEYFLRSIELSRQQGAAAWELRATIDLASNLARSGWVGKAISLLKPASGRIIGGSDTADVKAARLLLLTLVNRRFAEGMDKYER